MRYNTTHVQMRRDWLPHADVQLEHSSDSVEKRTSRGSYGQDGSTKSFYSCASVPIPAPVFVGILPTKPHFDPDATDYAKSVLSAKPSVVRIDGPGRGFYVIEVFRQGLMSYLTSSPDYEQADVRILHCSKRRLLSCPVRCGRQGPC